MLASLQFLHWRRAATASRPEVSALHALFHFTGIFYGEEKKCDPYGIACGIQCQSTGVSAGIYRKCILHCRHVGRTADPGRRKGRLLRPRFSQHRPGSLRRPDKGRRKRYLKVMAQPIKWRSFSAPACPACGNRNEAKITKIMA